MTNFFSYPKITGVQKPCKLNWGSFIYLFLFLVCIAWIIGLLEGLGKTACDFVGVCVKFAVSALIIIF